MKGCFHHNYDFELDSNEDKCTFETKYLKMDQGKFVEDRPYPFKFFKGCLPQILLGPFFNNLTQLCLNI